MVAELSSMSFTVDGDVFTVSGTLVLKDDSGNVLYQEPVSAKGNFRETNFYDVVKGRLTAVCQGIVDAYNAKMQQVSDALGVATPQEGLDKLAQDVLAALEV